MEKGRAEEYSLDNISRLMTQEKYGLHISLVDNGKEKGGKPHLDIVVESDIPVNTIKDIMWGLLDIYEEMDNE